MHSPATAEVVADLLFDGETAVAPVERLSSDRFADGDLLVEENVA